MAKEKEYVIALKKGVDYDRFWDDMETLTNLDGIPNRQVSVANRREGSTRSTHYYLTEQEKTLLEQDSRVRVINEPLENQSDVILVADAVQVGNFTKAPDSDGDNYVDSSGSNVNWGLLRHKATNNNYGTSYTLNEDYLYTLDGTGVDVVIQDSGMQAGHPEWEDANGVSRLQSIDWATASGLSFSNGGNNNTDTDGHGTHVGGIAAGKTYGWAKNARIYSMKVNGLQGSGDTNGVSSTYLFDSIKLWHRNKPIDPKTGKKRPTVVNMSWGYIHQINAGDSFTLNYRGTTHNSDFKDYGLATYNASANFRWGRRYSSIDSDVEELIDEGVIVVKSAGNDGMKWELLGGDDYDNYVTHNSSTKYYHRGGSPTADDAIIVGATDYNSVNATTDQRTTFSNTGPRVDIYAAGRFIMSAMATSTSRAGVADYHLDSNYKQHQLSGTSQASPNVTGVIALLLQANPGATPQSIRNYIIQSAGTVLNSPGSAITYTNNRSLLGGHARILYNKFGTIQTPVVFEGFGGIPVSVSI